MRFQVTITMHVDAESQEAAWEQGRAAFLHLLDTNNDDGSIEQGADVHAIEAPTRARRKAGKPPGILAWRRGGEWRTKTATAGERRYTVYPEPTASGTERHWQAACRRPGRYRPLTYGVATQGEAQGVCEAYEVECRAKEAEEIAKQAARRMASEARR